MRKAILGVFSSMIMTGLEAVTTPEEALDLQQARRAVRVSPPVRGHRQSSPSHGLSLPSLRASPRDP